MMNSWRIFFNDLKRIATNWVTFVILGGLVFLPSLYAWLNIEAAWDPYSQTDQMPVAIVNEDVGATVRDEDIHIGDTLVDTLKESDSMEWHFIDYDQAMTDLEKGDLFAAVVIPENFSEKLGTVVKASPEKANVEYYVNEKLNAISPKITEKGASVIVDEVSSNFISTVNGVIFEVFNEIGLELEKELPDIERFEDYVFEIEERLPDIYETLTGTLEDAGSAQDLVAKAKKEIPNVKQTVNEGQSTINQTHDFLTDAENRLNEMAPKIKADLEKARTSVTDINSFIGDIEDFDIDFSAGEQIKEDISADVDASIDYLESVEGALEAVLAQLKEDAAGESGGDGGSDEGGSTEEEPEGEGPEDGETPGDEEEPEDGEEPEKDEKDEEVPADGNEDTDANGNNAEDATEVQARANGSNDFYIEQLEETLDRVEKIKALLIEGRENVGKIEDFLQEKKGDVDEVLTDIGDIAENAGDRIDEFVTFYDETVEPTVLNEVAKAKSTLSEARRILSEVGAALPEVETLLNNSGDSLDDGTVLLEDVLNEYPYIEDKVGELADKIRTIQGETDLADIIQLLQNDHEAERGFFAEPVTLNENTLFPIENYGSGMTPFYTVLSLWVGGLLLISLLSTSVTEPDLFKPREIYFGKMLLFLLIGVLQTTIVTVGDIALLGVSMASPGWFIVFGLFCSMIFMIIIYTLVSIFGDVGKAMAIVMLVLQIAGSGGTYPVVLLPKFFQVISPFLPFTYAIDLMREPVGGIVWSNVIQDLSMLSIFGVIAIIFGTLLKEPINKHTNKLVEKSSESGVFH